MGLCKVKSGEECSTSGECESKCCDKTHAKCISGTSGCVPKGNYMQAEFDR